MSEMLVAYAACGCRLAALLDTSDDLECALFRGEFNDCVVAVENHDRIGSSLCEKHAAEERAR